MPPILKATTPRLLLLGVMIGAGCGQDPPQPVPQPTSSPQQTSIPFVKAGPRPQQIANATFVDLHTFHSQPLTAGQWVCLEGSAQVVSMMGMSVMHLRCPECRQQTGCEGEEFRIYIPNQRRNVIILGQTTGHNRLREARVVLPSELDDALAAEADSN